MIERKNYVYTTAEIQDLARAGMEATAAVGETRQTYLRALVGTTQAELKGTKGATQAMQAKALLGVHKRFYAAVMQAIITPDIAQAPRLSQEERTRRSLERNRRSNFARSAHSTLQKWLKVGENNLASLKAASVSKTQLIAATPRSETQRPVKFESVKAKVDALVGDILERSRELAKADPEQARAVLDSALQILALELFQGGGLTTSPQVAVRERRPLKAANTLFWPTARGQLEAA